MNYRSHNEAVEAMQSGIATGARPTRHNGPERKTAARDSLPEMLRPIFDDLYADSQSSAFSLTGFKWVSAEVCRDLVRAGWRKTDASTLAEKPQ